ncbi:MAG: IPTL-CTERM sorting domain-containing protein [Pseudomonadota bacterium]|nr:IPTL-CTERM sorting domain-containing protein [Pseudomonadota bacterium]
MAQATLTVIGTATYSGTDYNLIWDDDNNGNSVIWLDYSNAPAIWSSQMAGAAGLDGQLTYNIDPAYTITWNDAAWRLPATVDGPYVYSCDGTTSSGYNITSSEMGHLYYAELGNLGEYDSSCSSQAGYGLQNTGDFNNLHESWYWSGTEFTAVPVPAAAWVFIMSQGGQVRYITTGTGTYGLAVRGGQVVVNDAIPTLNEWGLIVLSLFFLGLGYITIRKQNSYGESLN